MREKHKNIINVTIVTEISVDIPYTKDTKTHNIIESNDFSIVYEMEE